MRTSVVKIKGRANTDMKDSLIRNVSKYVNASNKGNQKKLFRKIVDNFELSLLVMPAFLYFFVFHYLPMFGIVLAFKEYRYDSGILGSAWVGFDNFLFFFKSIDAWRITRNTVAYSLAFIVIGTLANLSIALLLYEINQRRALKVYQTIMIIPRFLSWVIVSFITYIFLHPTMGVINQVIGTLGIEAIDWYTQPVYWPFILVFVNIWQGIGMGSIIYYAALMGVDQGIYEAAKIDGANRWKQTIHISIPSLIPLMTIMLILALGGIFRGDFGLFFQVPRDVGVLYPVTDIIDTYVFRGLRSGVIGRTSAIGLFQSFVGLIMILTTNAVIKKIKPENSLF